MFECKTAKIMKRMHQPNKIIGKREIFLRKGHAAMKKDLIKKKRLPLRDSLFSF